MASEGNLTLLGVTPLTLACPTGRSGSPTTADFVELRGPGWKSFETLARHPDTPHLVVTEGSTADSAADAPSVRRAAQFVAQRVLTGSVRRRAREV